MRKLWLLCSVGFLLGACSVPERGLREPCQRTAQCQLGLACVQGKCSKDLGPIVDQSSVPDLGGGGEPASSAVDAAVAADGGAADGG